MTTIVIFTRTIDPSGYPFNDDYHWNAYFDLLLAIKEQGGQAYFATGKSYLGEGKFEEAYTTDKKVPLAELEKVKNVQADLVFEKGGFTGTDVLVINPPFVHNITASKAETYARFAKYQPRSVIAKNLAEAKAAIENMSGDLVVAKEPVSNGGRAVIIDTKQKTLAKLPGVYPIIVQEFVDTSAGIAGLVEGIHDVRVKIGGGKIFGGMVRTPAPGEYRANLAQGGQVRHLMPEDLPKDVVEIAREIDCYFEDYPRYYAIDLANTANGWKLIELNSKPGLSPISVSRASKHVIDQLARYLIATGSSKKSS